MTLKNNTNKEPLRVMADYGSSGFWNKTGMIVLNDIAITENLKEDIKKWIDLYKKQLDWSNPGAGCIFSESEKVSFLIFEAKIFQQIETQLREQYNLEFINTVFDD